MRKVTASAVILTALTGCSQSSGIPSAQWSFEVPTGETAQANATDTKKLSDAELSADAQSFLGETFGKTMMGPAFDQPTISEDINTGTDIAAGNALVGSKIPSLANPGSQQRVSSIALEAAGIASTTSSRPDPVDQVRSYLRASGRPSALANRRPYASQVYLSSAPTSNPASIADVPLLDLAPSSDLSSGVTPAAAPSIAPLIAFESGASNAFTATSYTNSGDTGTGFNQDYSAALAFTDTQAAYGDVAYSSSSSETIGLSATSTPPVIATAISNTENAPAVASNIAADGLPQLAPSQPSDLAFLDPSPQTAPPLEEENLSIGTAILRDLQRSSRGTVNASATVPIEIVSNQTHSASTNRQAFNNETSVSLAPGGSNYRPTLTSLRQTMPQREPSPLVIAKQASITSTPSIHLEFPSQPNVNDAELEALNLEALDVESVNGSNTQASGPATNTVVENEPVSPTPVSPTTAIEADLHSSSDGYSPLLEGLRATESPSTVYVPIAEEVSSNSLIQNAVMALGQEASTTALLEDIAFKDAFSSVLTSAALLSGESTARQTSGEVLAQSPLHNSTVQTGVIEITTEETTPSQSAKSSGSSTNLSRLRILQQGVLQQVEGKRRQLITWR